MRVGRKFDTAPRLGLIVPDLETASLANSCRKETRRYIPGAVGPRRVRDVEAGETCEDERSHRPTSVITEAPECKGGTMCEVSVQILTETAAVAAASACAVPSAMFARSNLICPSVVELHQFRDGDACFAASTPSAASTGHDAVKVAVCDCECP